MAVGLGALVAGFGVSYLVFSYAFISVWCFLAALISLALCCFFAKLRSFQENRPTSQDQHLGFGAIRVQ